MLEFLKVLVFVGDRDLLQKVSVEAEIVILP